MQDSVKSLRLRIIGKTWMSQINQSQTINLNLAIWIVKWVLVIVAIECVFAYLLDCDIYLLHRYFYI